MLTAIVVILSAVAAICAWKRFTSPSASTACSSSIEDPVESASDLGLPAVLHSILNLARWAPSGDNEQPWKFEVMNDEHIRIHCPWVSSPYDLDQHTQQLAIGALIENITIAASAHGLRADCTRELELPSGTPSTSLLFDIRFVSDASIQASPLIASIEQRTTCRANMSTSPLSQEEKNELAACVGEGYQLEWFESLSDRWKVAGLMYRTAGLRLSLPEAHDAHVRILDWEHQRSPDRLPVASLNLDPLSRAVMKWGITGGWDRMKMLNKYVGNSPTRLQMDLIPGIACAAHFAIRSIKQATSIDEFISGGRAMQRVWLTLTRLGLHMQPEIVPLVFARYVRTGVCLSAEPELQEITRGIEREVAQSIEAGKDGFPIVLARVGRAPTPKARSIRRPLSQLIITK